MGELKRFQRLFLQTCGEDFLREEYALCSLLASLPTNKSKMFLELSLRRRLISSQEAFNKGSSFMIRGGGNDRSHGFFQNGRNGGI